MGSKGTLPGDVHLEMLTGEILLSHTPTISQLTVEELPRTRWCKRCAGFLLVLGAVLTQHTMPRSQSSFRRELLLRAGPR